MPNPPSSVEEAIAQSGLQTLSHLRSTARKLTVDQVKAHERETRTERGGYAGPYATPIPGEGALDARNYWTSRQDKAEAYEPLPDVPPVTIEPTEASVGAGGTSGNTVAVTITGEGVSGTWTVDKQSEATWLQVLSPQAPMAADGVVIYNVASNQTGAPRSGQMYINGKTFTVNQD